MTGNGGLLPSGPGAAGGGNSDRLDDDPDENAVHATQHRGPAACLGRHREGHHVFAEVLDRRFVLVRGGLSLSSSHVTRPPDAHPT